MSGDAQVKVTMRNVKKEIEQAIVDGFTQVFAEDIVPAAADGSPVRTGHNKRSIDSEVERVPRGVVARMFTQSGYGGYLETGTKNMEAQPYMWPALMRFYNRLATVVKQKLAERAGG
jgi:HK97 gp10 family phage protein